MSLKYRYICTHTFRVGIMYPCCFAIPATVERHSFENHRCNVEQRQCDHIQCHTMIYNDFVIHFPDQVSAVSFFCRDRCLSMKRIAHPNKQIRKERQKDTTQGYLGG